MSFSVLDIAYCSELTYL